MEDGLNMNAAKASVPRAGFRPNPKLKLLDQVSEVMRFKHNSLRTEQAYRQWIKRFIFFHGKQHPRELGAAEVRSFLNDLATRLQVAVATQNQALNALVFLYREVLHLDLDHFGDIERPTRPARLPVVLTSEETRRLLAAMTGTHQLMARLLYGSGMRLMEGVRLRVKDLDFEANHIVVREGKGFKDRVTIFPESLQTSVADHLRRVKLLHEEDLRGGYGSVYLPLALSRKYPNAEREWCWQYVFPTASLARDPRGGQIRRGIGLVWAVLIGVVLHPTTINRTKRRETGENRVCADSRFMPTNLCPTQTHVNQKIPQPGFLTIHFPKMSTTEHLSRLQIFSRVPRVTLCWHFSSRCRVEGGRPILSENCWKVMSPRLTRMNLANLLSSWLFAMPNFTWFD